MRKEKCKKYEFEDDLRGCVLKHVGEARKPISKGDIRAADIQLGHVERHLREI